MVRNFVINFSLSLCVTLLSLLTMELGWRAIKGVSILSLKDLVNDVEVDEAQLFSNLMGTVVYDKDLGWVPPSFKNYENLDLRFIDYGIRKNNSKTKIQHGAILAVGDSFTNGAEVGDHQTWPAHLEAILGEPVLNGGVGGYGVDQIVLRAEKLINNVQPKILIMGMLDQDILRNEYSSFGAPKPYFTIKRKRLVRHNLPVPTISEAKSQKDRNWGILSRSHLFLDTVRIFLPNFMMKTSGQIFETVTNDPIEISCLLLKRLKNLTSKREIPLLLVMQYGGGAAYTLNDRPAHSTIVMDCAGSLDIPTFDEFETLQRVKEKGLNELSSHYVMHQLDPPIFGHMSEKGNRLIAEKIAGLLKKQN